MRMFLFLLLPLLAFADDLSEGLRLLKTKHYAAAEALLAKHDEPVALFGKALCHIALGEIDKSQQELKQIIIAPCECKDRDIKIENEQAIAYECRQKIRSVASQMRTLVERTVQETVPQITKKVEVLRELYPYIDLLEKNGINCCDNQYKWECCAEPLVQQFEIWNSEGLTKE